MSVDIGQTIDGKYRIHARIGEGGMGAVFAGEHLRLHRRVAIKILHAAMARDAEVVRRFEREAQAAGTIGNDHILEVLDIGELPDGERYIVMEFLDGEPMNARLERLGRLTPRQVYPLAREILEGLSAAHAAGIVHRDLKPANVFILREKAGRPDYVKIIDFGISKFQNVAGDEQRTRTGLVIGTPSYMSPEQARGLSEADGRADIYAVGVILYESVSGRLPFLGNSPTDLLFQIALSTAPPLQSLVSDVDPAFCSLVQKAMARDPGDRFLSAGEFIAALDAWAQRGQGVAVPVQVAQLPPPQQPMTVPMVTPPPATPGPHAGTPWASAQNWAPTPPPRRGGGAAVAVLVSALAIVLALGAFLALRTRGSGPAPSAAASLVPSSPPLQAPVSVEPPVASPPSPGPAASTAAGVPAPSAGAASLDPSAGGARPTASGRPVVAPPARRGAGPATPAPSPSPSPAPNGYNPFGHL